MAKYLYPAVFEKEEGMYNVVFPDLDGCYTCGTSIEDAYEMAQDALCMTLYELERQVLPIPKPTDIAAVQCAKDGFVSLVQCDTDDYRPQWTAERISDNIRNVAEDYEIRRVEMMTPDTEGTAAADRHIELMVEFRKPQVSLLQIVSFREHLKELVHTDVSVVHAPVEDDLFLEGKKKTLLYEGASPDTEETAT